MPSEVNITIEGAKGCGKTFIANIIAVALFEAGIQVTGEDIDTNVRDVPKCYMEYHPIELITTTGEPVKHFGRKNNG